MTGGFIGKPFVEHRRDFIENLQYGKQIDDFFDINNCQKRPQAPKPIFLGLESEESENQIPNFDIKHAPGKSVQNGSYTSPNELVRFSNEAKPICVEIQKHYKKCSHNLNGALIFKIENN